MNKYAIIKEFKQLAEEFADRKMCDIEFIEYHARHIEANIKNGIFTKFSFEILDGDTFSYEVCDYSKTYPRIGEDLTLDKFKKLIDEI